MIIQEELKGGCQNFDIVDSEFDHVAYYMSYHQMDLLTLMKGLKVLNECINRFCEKTVGCQIHVWNFYTASSYSLRGCYDGVCEVNGNTRSFIQESIRGRICYANEEFR